MTDITPEWLQSIGFEVAKGHIPKCYLWVDDWLMAHAVFMSEQFVRWYVNGNEFPEFAGPKTRAEALLLVAAMGRTVKDGAE